MNKNIKIRYGENNFLSISPNEESNILKEKVKQFILLIEDLKNIKTISIINDKDLERFNQDSIQDVLPYTHGRLHKCVEGILIEIQGPPLTIQGGNYQNGLILKDIPQD